MAQDIQQRTGTPNNYQSDRGGATLISEAVIGIVKNIIILILQQIIGTIFLAPELLSVPKKLMQIPWSLILNNTGQAH